MTPDISVIIPAYNIRSYVADAIDSALAQEGVTVEVVVVDDGSTDGTAEILAGYGGDPRVRIVSQGNTGPSISRNAGIAVATGRHIGFLDGDDLWEPGKAAAHVALLDSRPEIDVTYSWWRIIDENGNYANRSNTEPPQRLPAGMGFEGLIAENFTGTASTLICRGSAIRQVGGFDAALRSNVDLDLLLRLALLRDGNVALVPEILTSYRMHGTQITSDWRRMQGNWERVVEKMRGIAPERVAAVEGLARARVSRYLAYIAYVRGDHASARRLVAAAWRGAPRSLARDRRAWLTTLAVAATVLPGSVHDGLVAGAKRWRAGRAA